MLGLRPPGSNFESSVWRAVSSQSSHHPLEVLLAQFSLYVHKGGLKPNPFHFVPKPYTSLLLTLKLHLLILGSHHTNSFAHIIIKFKNKKVSLFLKIVALCSSSCGDYYGNIILIPIQIDSVMFCCSKSIEMIKDRSNRKSLRWL